MAIQQLLDELKKQGAFKSSGELQGCCHSTWAEFKHSCKLRAHAWRDVSASIVANDDSEDTAG